MSGYTQGIEDIYWEYNRGYMERTASESKNKIENVPENASVEDWKNILTSIGTEYTCSARFFLMKYLAEKAGAATDSKDHFQFEYKEKTYHFHKVNSDYAQNLPDEERDNYIELFAQISADNHNDKVNTWRPLFRKAMLKNKKLELLTRQEGFKIAHGLRFNLNQTEEFLLRVLDNDGFCYNRSDDLIEAFCFLYHPANNAHIAQDLKKLYCQKTDSIKKSETEQKPDVFTSQISFSLQNNLREWQKNADLDTTEQFMNWLIVQASFLDIPGKAAWKNYRKLTAFAYTLTKVLLQDNQNVPDMNDAQSLISPKNYDESPDGHLFAELCSGNPKSFPHMQEDFSDFIRNNCLKREDSLTPETDIYELTSVLLKYASNEFDNTRHCRPEQTWRYLTIHPETGRLTAEAIGEKIPLLLNGTLPVTKADLLFMLWYTCDLLWILSAPSDPADKPELLYDRIAGFWGLAEELLEESCLPKFYAPHLLERSFLNALVCADHFTEDSPFEIYENFCEIILPEKFTRDRVKKVDTAQTKAARKALEKAVETEFFAKKIDFEHVENTLTEHFLAHPAKGGQYLFTVEGIYFIPDSQAALRNPNPELLFSYPDKKTAPRFDMTSADYTSENAMNERFRFVYGLALYMKEQAALQGQKKDFRINYRQKVTLTIIK